ncbi:hypothetical protein RO3G_06698 [Rhizopus delemar RA 99-880]|uniref:Uncharacterized protein n=1 Tax=Rhizopus delemar (strain RA 99-880 / ATCC MYA-4621 / FGSC 9543 / NRRL 43880) TaxID=246409 RepID=I1C0L3_RHIO9|nr:hypothetical protein RO3G_06698 [Rhizopus delemar RA 99-880]|eukprot:EIE81993.1 hypothetical protein RO3G_06698 [Rhizopus delemar RA 99-880]
MRKEIKANILPIDICAKYPYIQDLNLSMCYLVVHCTIDVTRSPYKKYPSFDSCFGKIRNTQGQ